MYEKRIVCACASYVRISYNERCTVSTTDLPKDNDSVVKDFTSDDNQDSTLTYNTAPNNKNSRYFVLKPYGIHYKTQKRANKNLQSQIIEGYILIVIIMYNMYIIPNIVRQLMQSNNNAPSQICCI